MILLAAQCSTRKASINPRQRIINSDVMDFTRAYRGEYFHALLCDPPYHLTSITKRFGKPGSAPAKFGRDGAFARASKGFMNQTWDGGEIAFNPSTWEAFGSIMLDGAFGMAFASTRGYHRMACAIEDAGFIVHPMICWAFGSGFPKATRVPDSRFEGHRYGAQAIKPSLEPICVFQKPYRGRSADSIISTGAGTFNIDAGRIGESDGRWPGNLALVHSANCKPDRCVPGCPVLLIGEQSGQRSAGGNIVDATSEPATNIYSGRFNRQRDYEGYGDTGTAARFFFNSDWSLDVEAQITTADPFLYVPKASAQERNQGLEGWTAQRVNDGRRKSIDNAYQRGETQRLNTNPAIKPISLTKWLASLLLPPMNYVPRRLLIPFSGSGSEMIGAFLAGWDVIYGIEQSQEYAAIARARLDYYTDPLRTMRVAMQPMVPVDIGE